jgi:arginase
VHVGGRDWSEGEEEAMHAAGVTVVRRPAEVPAALDRLAEEADRILFHVDLDVIDSAYGRANQFACAGGLSPAEVVKIVRLTKARFPLAAIELASYDPSVDPEGAIARAGVAIVRAALG